MTKSTSVFLDCLRILAALLVFATHCDIVWFGGRASIPGRDGVVVFFVLSGYVIAYTTSSRRDMNARQYVIARLSRLYSVVIPALLFTALLLGLESIWNPAYVASLVRPYDGFRFFCTTFFLQSVWWRNLTPPTNVAFWSLGYEFWYYAMFGFWFFAKDWKWKIGGVIACCLIVGQNVLLLLPIWVVGAAIYYLRDRSSISSKMAWVGFVISLMVIALLVRFFADCPVKAGHEPHFFSASYISDNLLGLAVGSMIWFFARAARSGQVAPAFEKCIRWGAGHTFSLYLLHFPLIYFAASFSNFNPYVWWQSVMALSLIAVVILAISEVTEAKRKYLQKALLGVWT